MGAQDHDARRQEWHCHGRHIQLGHRIHKSVLQYLRNHKEYCPAAHAKEWELDWTKMRDMSDEQCRSHLDIEEDADSLGFKPVQNEWTKIWRNWYEADNTTLKARFSDVAVTRLPLNEEMLGRLMGLLDDGLYLAILYL